MPPYDVAQNAARELLSGRLDGMSFWSPSGLSSEMVNLFRTPAQRECLRDFRPAEQGLKDVFGKPGVLPSAAEYLEDLTERQKTAFAEIIIGQKDLDYCDTFIEEWYVRGGRRLTQEANEFYRVQQEVFRRLGVPGATKPASGPVTTR